MALIIKQQPQVPPKPELATVVEHIKQISTELHKQMRIQHTRAYMAVWKNPHYAPEEIVAAFGSDAIALFQLSAGVQQILKTADPDYQVLSIPEQYDVAFNADGTVTVTEKVPNESA